jgi:hypothetical protein
MGAGFAGWENQEDKDACHRSCEWQQHDKFLKRRWKPLSNLT